MEMLVFFFSGCLNCTTIKSFTYMQNKLWVGGTRKAFIEVSILSCFLPHYSVLYQVSINVFHIHVCYCCCILNAELRDHMAQHSSFTWGNFDHELLAQGSPAKLMEEQRPELVSLFPVLPLYLTTSFAFFTVYQTLPNIHWGITEVTGNMSKWHCSLILLSVVVV